MQHTFQRDDCLLRSTRRRPSVAWFILLGYQLFIVIAAANFDAEESVGVDGALKKIVERRFGPAMLVVVALGLLCFGLFSFVEARYRKIHQA